MRIAREQLARQLSRRVSTTPVGGDRVDAEIRPRAVRRAAVHLDLEAGEPAVGDGEPLVGRLADDHVIRPRAVRDEPLGAERRVLLVCGARDDDGSRRSPSRSRSRAATSAAATAPFMS